MRLFSCDCMYLINKIQDEVIHRWGRGMGRDKSFETRVVLVS